MSSQALFSDTVFLLGAGASIEAGCYSSKGILSDLNKQISKPLNFNHDLELQGYFQEIFSFILSTLSYQHTLRNPDPFLPIDSNIEDFVMIIRQIIDREFLIPAPLVANWSNKIEGWETKKDGIFDQYLRFITKLLIEKWANRDLKRSEAMLEPLHQLILNPDIEALDFFTLNYDLSFESAFYRDNEDIIDTGFTQSSWANSFGSHSGKLRYHKLHGSLNWYFDELTESVKQTDGDEADESPLIIFGSNYKMQSYDPFLSLLSNFKSKLASAHLYVIIGYSFHDRYINNILIQSLSEGDKLALVVDPHLESNEKGFINKIEKIQNSRSISDLINLTRINEDRIKIITESTSSFYSKFLGNNAALLIEEWEKLNRDSKPF